MKFRRNWPTLRWVLLLWLVLFVLGSIEVQLVEWGLTQHFERSGGMTLVLMKSITLRFLGFLGFLGLILTIAVVWIVKIVDRKQLFADRLSDVFAVSREFLWEADPSFQFTWVSQKVFAILGVQSEELIHWSFLNLLHQRDRESVSQQIQELLAAQLPIFGLECRLVARDRQIVWVRLTGIPRYDSQGEWLGYRGSCDDITASKEQQAKLRALYEDNPDGVVLCDKGGRILEANRAFETLVRASQTQLRHQNFHDDLIAGNTGFAKSLKQVLGSNEPGYWSGELHRAHDTLPVAITLRSLEVAAEPIICCMVRDISSIKLAEKKLIEARNVHEQASEAKSRFLANMSHEMRTPLNSVIGFADLLLRNLTEGTNQQWCRSIHASGKQLLALINDLLDLSKIEAGKLEIQPRLVNLQLCLEELVQSFEPRLKEKKLKFKFERTTCLPTQIWIDETRFKQILNNFLSNAIKFTDSGEIRLRVSFETEGEKGHLICSVHDTGIGIHVEDQQRIFEAFERNHSAFQNVEGTGLGLAISRYLARRMRGDISVHSEEGKGSEFRLEFKEIFFENRAELQSQPEEETQVPYRKVLVVEDNELNRLLLVDCVEQLGMEYREATNGQEALEILELFAAEVILLDLAMPVMDGTEFLVRLRSDSRLSKIPVLLITASGNSAVMNVFGSAQPDGVLLKPVRRAELVANLCQLEQTQVLHALETKQNSEMNAELLQHIQDTVLEEVVLCRSQKRIGRIQNLAARLLQLGQDYQFDPLIDYAQQLEQSSIEFDVQGIMQVLVDFESRVETWSQQQTTTPKN